MAIALAAATPLRFTANSSIKHGGSTFIVVMKRASNSTGNAIIMRFEDSGFFASGAHIILAGTTDKLTSASWSAPTITGKVADGWIALGITKGSGNVLPRYHKYVYSTGVFTHESNVGGNEEADGTAIGAGGVLTMSRFNETNGDYAAIAAYPRAISDDEFEKAVLSAEAMKATNPTWGMWLFNGGGGQCEEFFTGSTFASGTAGSVSTTDAPFGGGHQVWYAETAPGAITAAVATATNVLTSPVASATAKGIAKATAAAVLASPSVAATAKGLAGATSSSTLPSPAASGSAKAVVAATATTVLASPTVSATASARAAATAALSLPSPTATAAASAQARATGNSSLPSPSAAATASAIATATANLSLPTPNAASGSGSPSLATASATLPSPTAASTAVSRASATASLGLASVVASGAATTPHTAATLLQLPMLVAAGVAKSVVHGEGSLPIAVVVSSVGHGPQAADFDYEANLVDTTWAAFVSPLPTWPATVSVDPTWSSVLIPGRDS